MKKIFVILFFISVKCSAYTTYNATSDGVAVDNSGNIIQLPANSITVFDGLNVYVFSSVNERNTFMSNTYVWHVNVDRHKAEIQAAVQQLVDSVALAHWYDNMNDVPKTAIGTNNEVWRAEAYSLIHWEDSIWRAVDYYFENVTSNNAVSVSSFINTLPVFAVDNSADDRHLRRLQTLFYTHE